MLQILFVFFYMGITTWILGYGALSLFNRSRILTRGTPYRVRHRLSYILTGVVCVTVYAQIFSLFAPVGLAANLVLIAVCILILFCSRRRLGEALLARAGAAGTSRARRRLPDGFLLSHRIWLLYLLLILGVAYGTSHGIMHYDTGLYHAQSIRFIEEYGVVRGIANLHTRLGYNSASFAFSALYSFAFTGGASLHAGAGFFALLLSFSCLDLKHILRRRRPVLTDFIRFAGLYYLFNIFKEMVSPAPDYFLNCLLFCLLILWIDLDVAHERHLLPYVLLTLGACFAVTIKLSAAPLLLLAVKPAVRIIREARRSVRTPATAFRGVRKKSAVPPTLRALAVCIGLGLIVAGPYIVRNILISGWPLYPSTTPGFPAVAWQMPRIHADGDAAGIRAYAQGVPAPAPGMPSASFSAWFPTWFAAQGVVSKALIVADLCALVGFFIWLVLFVVRLSVRYRQKQQQGRRKQGGHLTPVFRISRYCLIANRDFLFLEAVLLAAFLFWFLASPLIRYGFFFVWTPPLLLLGQLVLRRMARLPEGFVQRLTGYLALLLTAFLLYKGIRLIVTDATLMHIPYLTTQQPYEVYPVEAYEVDGVTFYAPVEGDRTGYYGFPGGDHQGGFHLLGDSLKDGIGPGE